MLMLSDTCAGERTAGRVPEPPELVLVRAQRAMFPGPRVSAAVSYPHVIARVCQHVAQARGRWVGDPVTACSQETVLEEDRRPHTCRTPQTVKSNLPGTDARFLQSHIWIQTQRDVKGRRGRSSECR